jgi:hypothetical protein
MDSDKARELIDDVTETEWVSSCCGANLYWFNDGCGLCSDCKEWSGAEKAEEENSTPIRAFSAEQEAMIARMEAECRTAGCDDNGHKHD